MVETASLINLLTSHLPEVTKVESVSEPSQPSLASSTTPDPPPFPLALVLSCVLVAYLLVLLILIGVRSYITRRGLAAECCGVSDTDSTCHDCCSSDTLLPCCTCSCSSTGCDSCVEWCDFHVVEEFRLCWSGCRHQLRDCASICSCCKWPACPHVPVSSPTCTLPACGCSQCDCSKIIQCNCNCLDPHCGLLDCCCIQLRIKRKEVVVKEPTEKNPSSWSSSEEDFEHHGKSERGRVEKINTISKDIQDCDSHQLPKDIANIP